MASDLYTGQSVVFKEGSVAKGIVASCSVPIIFEPIKEDINGIRHLLIDGVASDPLPIQVLIDEQIDIKIAVPIRQLDLTTFLSKNPKMFSIFLRSRSMMAEKITNISTNLADVIIRPDVGGIHMLDSGKNFQKIIKAGEASAHTAIKRIKYLLYRQQQRV